MDITNCTCILILYGLSRESLLEFFLNIYPGYLLEIFCKIGCAGFVETLIWLSVNDLTGG